MIAQLNVLILARVGGTFCKQLEHFRNAVVYLVSVTFAFQFNSREEVHTLHGSERKPCSQLSSLVPPVASTHSLTPSFTVYRMRFG